MFRTILFFAATIIYMILGMTAWPFALFLKLIGQEKACNYMTFYIVKFACWIAIRMNGIHLDSVEGLEYVTREPALYIMNHRSIFDIILTYAHLKSPTGFVAKKEMKKLPIFSVWMWFVKCLFLDRKDIRQGFATMNKGAEQLKNGISMSIFPEGTRNKDNSLTTLLPFKGGALKMAVKADKPIIPVAIYNSAACWERDFPRMHSCHVRMKFGEPIYASRLDKENRKFLCNYVQNTMQNMLNSFEENQ